MHLMRYPSSLAKLKRTRVSFPCSTTISLKWQLIFRCTNVRRREEYCLDIFKACQAVLSSGSNRRVVVSQVPGPQGIQVCMGRKH
ncbi:hypothetical protein CGRA01v4_02144 [Colletotrichum graminicola]|nr:hypothetical protein CGRA01v4_02144 [Colletotrichum graminicola]